MTVLVAYNVSPHGEAAVRTALEEAGRRHLPLHVIVLDPQPADAPVPAELAAVLADTGADADVRSRDEDTEPADAILDAAEETGATLVVVGSRKRSSQGTFLMGTTTQRVLLDCPVPVLVVKDAYGA
ncbi:nucleotide-binding universal stress UspA family protein [Isoptericola sp. CG 20/1183]|jgi:nucleotide-binding universal stress UspA family protein|uniref:Nucleotide-binding universal stress UspA family protein n=1 Tax=Isoptericola halotolerans TaxID=300560 RepID=A0ABX5EFC9_9MICO|nr:MULTISPECIES: universal stress protein [Isoptericola]MCK0118875.1 universal stress protein [Isoptericola sp. S6320L]PRZ07815.1 nucleotide-binding universal stress UspA family protein [Isoptericola halotolerans]PRZ07826.1 nucleotide-binding universal stress UspA family protein [Isoptericola sp. CG 20/1183]